MSQIEIKIDGRVFKVGEEKIWNGSRVSVEGFTGCRMIINDNGVKREIVNYMDLTDIPPKRTVPMTYEDLRDLVAREKGGVEFKISDGIKILFPVICEYSNGQLTICGIFIENIRCYRLYSENWAVEHPFTKEVEG